MKLQEKELSKKLRGDGFSINEICKRTGFSKGSVSLWVRDIKLTDEQRMALSGKGIKKEVIESRRITRLKRESEKRFFISNNSEKDINELSKKDLFISGIVFYWAEGAKRTKGVVSFSNSDPQAIKLMMRFFRESCDIPENKFRGYIHIHPHLDPKVAEEYWSDISNIPLTQFYKTYRKPNKSSLNKKDSLPYGTFDIIICNTELLLKIKGWIKGMCNNFGI